MGKTEKSAAEVKMELARLHLGARVAIAADGGFRRATVVDLGKNSVHVFLDGRKPENLIGVTGEDVGNVVVGFLKDSGKSIKKFTSAKRAIGKAVTGEVSEEEKPETSEEKESRKPNASGMSPRETGYRRKIEEAELPEKKKARKKAILKILGKKEGQNLSGLQQKLLEEYTG